MNRKKHVFCLMSQEKPSSIEVVDDVLLEALTLEAHQSVMGERAKEIVWQHDAPSVVFYDGNGTKYRSMGVIDLPCVVGGQNMQIKMHVVPGEVPCLLSKGWLKENGCRAEYLVRGARVDKETNHCVYVRRSKWTF